MLTGSIFNYAPWFTLNDTCSPSAFGYVVPPASTSPFACPFFLSLGFLQTHLHSGSLRWWTQPPPTSLRFSPTGFHNTSPSFFRCRPPPFSLRVPDQYTPPACTVPHTWLVAQWAKPDKQPPPSLRSKSLSSGSDVVPFPLHICVCVKTLSRYFFRPHTFRVSLRFLCQSLCDFSVFLRVLE